MVIIINWFFYYFLLEHWIYSACLLASSWMNLCSKEVQLIVERCSCFSRTFTRNSNSPLEDVSWQRSRDFPPLSRSTKAKLIHSRYMICRGCRVIMCDRFRRVTWPNLPLRNILWYSSILKPWVQCAKNVYLKLKRSREHSIGERDFFPEMALKYKRKIVTVTWICLG